MTHTGSRRFPVLFAALATLALAGAVLALLFSPVQAQEGDAPAAPTGLASEVSHDSVTLTWDDPKDDSITGYRILRRETDRQDPGVFTTINRNTGNARTAYTDGTVEPETRYVYRVKAINAHGVSGQSNYADADTPAAPRTARQNTAPSAPGNLEGGGRRHEGDAALGRAADDRQHHQAPVPLQDGRGLRGLDRHPEQRAGRGERVGLHGDGSDQRHRLHLPGAGAQRGGGCGGDHGGGDADGADFGHDRRRPRQCDLQAGQRAVHGHAGHGGADGRADGDGRADPGPALPADGPTRREHRDLRGRQYGADAEFSRGWFLAGTATADSTLTATIVDGNGYAPGTPATADVAMKVFGTAATVKLEQETYTVEEGRRRRQGRGGRGDGGRSAAAAGKS